MQLTNATVGVEREGGVDLLGYAGGVWGVLSKPPAAVLTEINVP